MFARLHADGCPWADMAVVYRAPFVEQEIGAAFERAGIPTVTLTKRARDHGARARSSGVDLVTFHSSKGLEYRIVAIPGLGFMPNARFPEADEVRLAYVASNRPANTVFPGVASSV